MPTPKRFATKPSERVVLQGNTEKVQAARRGSFKLWTACASAGSQIRQVRVEGTNTLKESMATGVWAPNSVIKVMEDLDWCEKNKLTPLYELYKGPVDETGAFIGGIELIMDLPDIKLRRFLIIDGMHRVTTWNELRLYWDEYLSVEGEENPFNWIAAEHVWLYDQRALGTKLVNFVATRSNQDQEISVKMNWLDWMTTMRQFHVAYVESFDGRQMQRVEQTFTAFARWYSNNVDDSFAPSTLRVYASQAIRLHEESIKLMIAKFLPATVPLSFVGHTHQGIDNVFKKK